MDFGKYKFIKTNGYLISDILIVVVVCLLCISICTKQSKIAGLAGIFAGFTFIFGCSQFVFGYTKIENDSDSDLDVLLESNEMGCTTTKKKPVYNVDGICVKKTGKVYKIAEGMHAKVNKDYTITQKSFILSQIAKILHKTKEMKYEDLENDFDKQRWGQIFPKK